GLIAEKVAKLGDPLMRELVEGGRLLGGDPPHLVLRRDGLLLELARLRRDQRARFVELFGAGVARPVGLVDQVAPEGLEPPAQRVFELVEPLAGEPVERGRHLADRGIDLLARRVLDFGLLVGEDALVRLAVVDGDLLELGDLLGRQLLERVELLERETCDLRGPLLRLRPDDLTLLLERPLEPHRPLCERILVNLVDGTRAALRSFGPGCAPAAEEATAGSRPGIPSLARRPISLELRG